MKRGIAVFYDPHNVYQFLWYYCTYGKDVEWTALCLPNNREDRVSSFCRRLGIFDKIYVSKEAVDAWGLKRQCKEFIKMFFYAIVGKQHIYAKKYIARLTENTAFDESVVLTDCGFVSGLFIALGKEKRCTILEDGIGDYLSRKYINILKSLNNSYAIKGFVMAMLGYVNFSSRYPLRTTKECIKFSSQPEKMQYKQYKIIKQLFNFEKTDMTLFSNKLSCIYPGLAEYFKNKPQAILLTVHLTSFAENSIGYYKKVEDYINNLGVQRIVLKKHPIDDYNYSFAKNIEVIEVDQNIPSEVLIPYLNNMTIYFMYISSTNMYMNSIKEKPFFFYFMGLEKEKSKIGCPSNYPSISEFKKKLSFWNLGNSKIIKL